MKISFNQFNKPPFIKAIAVSDYQLSWYHKDSKMIMNGQVYKHTQAWKHWNLFRPLAPCILFLNIYSKIKGGSLIESNYLVELNYLNNEDKLEFRPIVLNDSLGDVTYNYSGNPTVIDVEVFIKEKFKKKL